MTDATTTNYGWTKPTVGADANNWGGLLNADLDSIDADLFAVSNTANAARPSGEVTMWGGASANVPNGWLLCNGAAVSRTAYAALFAAIGSCHGAGDGSTTFNLPNLTDRFVVGAGDLYALAGIGGAASASPAIGAYTLQIADIPGHAHTLPDLTHTHAVTDAGHLHSIADGGHTHSATDAGHAHVVAGVLQQPGSGVSLGGSGGQFAIESPSTSMASASISVAGSLTGITQTQTGEASVTVATALGGTLTTASAGGGGGHSHVFNGGNPLPTLPPYYALFYIIKT